MAHGLGHVVGTVANNVAVQSDEVTAPSESRARVG